MNDSLVLVEPDDAVRGREAVAVVDEGATAHDVALTGANNGSLEKHFFLIVLHHVHKDFQ